MAHARYSNAFVKNSPIVFEESAPTVGTLLSEYDVYEYWDLRATSEDGGARRAYIVSLRQRITIANDLANSFSGLKSVDKYGPYPLLIVQRVSPAIKKPTQGVTFYIEDYFPKTLNASVTTTHSDAMSSSKSSSVEHMSGSAYSVTNSYDLSASVGFLGMAATGGVSGGYGHSTTSTTEMSDTTGQTTGRDARASNERSMSIKDWASYAFADSHHQEIGWVWGQEYPWNIISFHNTALTGEGVRLPNYVKSRLIDAAPDDKGKPYVYPPSDISQFGLNFVVNAKWVFYVSGPAGEADETVSFSHALTYWKGNHDAHGVTASIIADDRTIETIVLNLPMLALEPIVAPGAGNGAVIGFNKSRFITPPTSPTTQFRVKSGSNNLYARGTGFDALSSADSILTAPSISKNACATLTLNFKVVDENIELALLFKHWKMDSESCVMTICINERDPEHPENPITRHVDALDAGSGTDNVSTVTLRKRDYASTEFFDYLVVGLNTVVVTIAPAEESRTCGYALRAVAIG